MLYVSSNGETCKDQLCQHPECWQTNVRRVKEAVRQRNGIIDKEQIVNESGRRRLKQKKKLSSIPQNEILSLPTLKVIDVTRNITTPFDNGSDDDDACDQVFVEEERSPSYSTLHLSPIRNKRHISFGTHAPHTTPVSPSIPEHKRQSRWKGKICCSESDDEKAKKISFHEIYDYEEVYQDWQETFISSAYLVWCPSKKQKKEKRRSRASSATTDFKTRGYKDIVEHALPLPVEVTPKKRRKAKYPTGGQPYSPCRSPVTKYEHFRCVDNISDGDLILTVAKEKIPESLITSKKIIEHKTRSSTKDLPHSQVQKSDSNKVLVDISSQLSLPTENQAPSCEETDDIKGKDKNALDNEDLVKRIERKRPKTAGTSQKLLSDFEPRKVLPLPSVGIPWGLIPMERRDHCKNSIPHGVELGVVMEPVIYQARSASARGSKKHSCANVDPSKGKTLKKEGELRNSTDDIDERDHLTSAYRFSPRRLVAPAPTPMTPSTRDGTQRQLSDLIRSNATRSLSKEQRYPKTRHEDGSDGTEGTSSRHAPGTQRLNLLDDHVILEVEETNRNNFHEIVAEFSEMSVGGRDEDRRRTTNLDESAVKVNDSDSAISLRAVSPSSRINIPPDIWAELRGLDFDERRITPGKHLDLRHHDRVNSTSVTRGFHSSLGLSVYSYTESSWKPAKLPQSFIGLRTCQGPYRQTILPRMPASLTVVPVPCVTRSAKTITNEPRHYHLAQSSSIRMPPVPVASPVLEIEITFPDQDSKHSSQTTVDWKESSEFRVISEGTGPERKKKGGDVAEADREIGPEHKYEHVPGEVEYLIARDVISHRDVSENVGENDEEQEVGTEMSVMESDLKYRRWEMDMMHEQKVTNGESASVLLGESSEALSKEAEHGCESSESDKRRLQEEKPIESATIDQLVVERTMDHGIEIALDRSSCISNVADRPQSRTDTRSRDSIPKILGSFYQAPETQVSQVEDHNIDAVRYDEDLNTVEDLLNDDFLPRASNFDEQVLPVISHESLASKNSGDFELEPFNVESELLQPIHIESDLFLLSGDSYLGLSFDESELDNFDDTSDAAGSPHKEVQPEA